MKTLRKHTWIWLVISAIVAVSMVMLPLIGILPTLF